eukprot:238461_1
MSLSQQHTEHIALIGDSIFDNITYVRDNDPDVVQQLKHKITDLNWTANNYAVDGAITEEIMSNQLHTIPKDVTTIIVSSGGNDGLNSLYELTSNLSNWLPWNFTRLLWKTRQDFQHVYSNTLQSLTQRFPNSKIICCTIYYPMFTEYSGIIQAVSNIGVNIMGSVIINSALKYGNIPVIDLRYIFDKKEDYANSIEPGVPGGDKITNNIIHIVKNHDFNKEYNKEKYVIYKINNYSDGLDPSHYGSMHW